MDKEKDSGQTISKEIAKLAVKGKPLSDESVDAAINEMRTKRLSGEIKKEPGNEISFAKHVMRANILRRKQLRFKKIAMSIASFVFLLSLSLGVGISLSHQGGNFKSNTDLKELDYDKLTYVEIDSIKQFNQEEEAQFYWLDNMEILETILMYEEDNLVMIQEKYLFDDIPVSITIVQKDIYYLSNLSFTDKIFLGQSFSYIEYNGSLISFFANYYNYFIQIDSTDEIYLEPVLSKLTNS